MIEVLPTPKWAAREAHAYEDADFTPEARQKMRIIMKEERAESA